MKIAWDETKRQAVLKRRGIDLLRAVLVLQGPTIAIEDQRYDYGETRFIATGEIEGEYYTVVFTKDADTVRIVTAWRAGRRARRRHQERYPGGTAGNASSR
jgi:uncharacterized DUF497 family protein